MTFNRRWYVLNLQTSYANQRFWESQKVPTRDKYLWKNIYVLKRRPWSITFQKKKRFTLKCNPHLEIRTDWTGNYKSTECLHVFAKNAHFNKIRKSCPSRFRIFWIPSTRTVWNIQRSNNSNLVLAWIKSFFVVLLNVLCTTEILILCYVLAMRMKKAGFLSVEFVQCCCSMQLTRDYFWV